MDKRKNSKVPIQRLVDLSFYPLGLLKDQEERKEEQEEGGQESDWRGSRDSEEGVDLLPDEQMQHVGGTRLAKFIMREIKETVSSSGCLRLFLR